MALYAIGDIHGHSSLLQLLMETVAPTPDDTLVFLGDYVDKGPDVAGTLDYLIQLASRNQCIFIRGNHDQSLLNAIQDTSRVSMWECLAGQSPLASYGSGSTRQLLHCIPETHVEFLRDTCCNYHETEHYIFVHAGIRQDLSPEEEEVERLHWSSMSLAHPHSSGKTVICGHTAQVSGNILDLGHSICVDTAITKDGWLSCLNLDNFTFNQVSHEKVIRSGRLRI